MESITEDVMEAVSSGKKQWLNEFFRKPTSCSSPIHSYLVRAWLTSRKDEGEVNHLKEETSFDEQEMIRKRETFLEIDQSKVYGWEGPEK